MNQNGFNEKTDIYCDLEKVKSMRQEVADINRQEHFSKTKGFFGIRGKHHTKLQRVEELEKQIANELAKPRAPTDAKLKDATYGLSKGQDIVLLAAGTDIKLA
jgi:hypothetical protein